MKFLIVSFALAAVAAAQYQGYKEPAAAGRQANILRQASEVNPDGSYTWSYETDNGISAAESGALKAVGANGQPAIAAEGGYQYTAPDGQVIAVKYVAGPQGFVAEGAHLPVAPPIPEAIARALAYIQAHPQKEDAYYKSEQEKSYYTAAPAIRPVYQTTPRPYYQPTQQPFRAGFAQQPYYAGRR